MEIEQSTPEIAKKLWRIVRVVFYMLRKGLSKSKLWVDLHMMLKRGKLAGKAITNLMLDHHYAALTCRSDDIHMSFVAPREYEFSCSNSPVYPSFYAKRNRNNHRHHHQYHLHHRHHHSGSGRTAGDDNVAQKLVEMLNHYYSEPVEASPMLLPGFGRSPKVPQLRVTDSPFPLKDTDEDAHVDKAADEFIKKFYKELEQQKKRTALESPSPYHKLAYFR